MKKTMKLLALLLALVMLLSCFAGCKKSDTAATNPTQATNPPATDNNNGSGTAQAAKASFTYRDYAVQLGTNWNPHTWTTDGDKQILQYLQTPLVTAAVKDSEQGIYQWVYKAAASITDVTAANQADLSKYNASGNVFEIKLNAAMKWQDGTAITADDYVESMKALLDPAKKNARAADYCNGAAALAGAAGYFNGTGTFEDAVGCYKVDDTTIRYVTKAKLSLDEFLMACTTNWLVHKATYEAGNYGTSLETTVSYGPYKLESVQAGEQVVLVQNENYYQYTKKDDGTLYAETDYEVDGGKVQAYQTTKIIIDAMTEEEAKAAFMKGELSRWEPTDDELPVYATSEQLRQEDQADTYGLYFNANEASLKKMDASKGNKNSVVLSNANFRKAFSMAIDREDWVTVTPAYKAAYNVLNYAYYYDIFKDPTSIYRDAAQAMQSMCDVYGVKWVDGAMYGTLEEAYGSISGYYPDEAKSLMAAACNELVSAGLYTKGEEIKIRVAYSAEALTDSQQEQIDKLNEYLNAAASGSGFGTITLEAVGEVENRVDKVVSGEFAIGYGPCGGEVLSPFAAMQKYLDPQNNKVQEKGSWDPATEKLTLKIDGESVTMTWKEWSYATEGNGKYASASVGIKLDVVSALEREFLRKFYRIPLAAGCDASLQSYQVQDYAEHYNVMYGFGGMELLTYTYSDTEWTAQIAKNGGTLGYE